MADKSWIPYSGSLEVNAVELWCDVVIGSTGAVTSSSGKGITSVTRVSAGQYAFLLDSTYNKLLWADCSSIESADSDPTTVGVLRRIKSEAVASTTAPKITIQCFAADDGAAADPASGTTLKLCAKLRNSSVT